MLYLLFHLGDERFALDAREVVEVVPIVNLRPVHDAPEYVAGLFNYRGTVVPVVDLCRLTSGNPCSRRMSTRIIIVRHTPRGGEELTLGLMAEKVTEAVQQSEARLASSKVVLDVALQLGEIATGDEGMLQCLSLDRLLPDGAADLLGSETDGDEHAAAND
jgi:chemotaxis-related protein WspB